MFWNDIEEIKEGLGRLEIRIDILDHLVRKCVDRASIEGSSPNRENCPMFIRCDGDRVLGAAVEDIKELLCDVFSSEEENNTINRLHDKLDALIKDGDRAKDVLISEKILDKFEDYMKNVDKFNAMINEFKGCVSLARSSLEERKKVSHEEAETARIWVKIAENLQKQEKKSRKKKKSIKKKAVVSPLHRS